MQVNCAEESENETKAKNSEIPLQGLSRTDNAIFVSRFRIPRTRRTNECVLGQISRAHTANTVAATVR